MVSTITTATIITVADVVLASSLSLIAILVLLALLIQKEVMGAAAGARAKAFSDGLSVVLVPLLLSFGLMALARVVGVLR